MNSRRLISLSESKIIIAKPTIRHIPVIKYNTVRLVMTPFTTRMASTAIITIFRKLNKIDAGKKAFEASQDGDKNMRINVA